MIQLDLKLQDFASASLRAGAVELGGSMAGAWALIGDAAVASVRANFAVGGRPAWAPLSASRVRQKGHSRPLIDTGRMMDSNEYRLTGNGLELYNTVDYADIHQFGTSHVPARPFLVLQSSDYLLFAGIIDRCLNQYFGR